MESSIYDQLLLLDNLPDPRFNALISDFESEFYDISQGMALLSLGITVDQVCRWSPFSLVIHVQTYMPSFPTAG
jgi:hypothetical protein